MPWSSKQYRVAQAVDHGWQPTGSAKNFARTVKSGSGKGESLASLIASEGPKRKKRKAAKKYGLGAGW